MYPGLDSLPPFIERGASNGRMHFLRERKVWDCQPWDVCCQGGFWILRGQRGNSVLLKTPFFSRPSHLHHWKKYIYVQCAASVIRFKETFMLLMKVRRKEREGVDGKKRAHAVALQDYEKTVRCKTLLYLLSKKIAACAIMEWVCVCWRACAMCVCVRAHLCVCVRGGNAAFTCGWPLTGSWTWELCCCLIIFRHCGAWPAEYS